MYTQLDGKQVKQNSFLLIYEAMKIYFFYYNNLARIRKQLLPQRCIYLIFVLHN